MSEEISEVLEETPQEGEQTVEVDLSKVPEAVQEYVDPELYQSDEDYKQAVEHGWKPKELHEKEGGDPDFYTGYKHFVGKYKDRQEIKALKSDLEEVKNLTKKVVQSFDEEKQQAVEKALATKEAQIKEAIEEGDAERVHQLTQDLAKDRHALENQAPAASSDEVIASFRGMNTIVQHTSPDFDPVVNAAFESLSMQKAKAMTDSLGRALTPEEVNNAMTQAFTEVESRFRGSKPQQQQPVARAKGKKAPVDPVAQLSKHGKEIYDMIHDTRGKDAADNYAAGVAGGR